ncbi:beta-propeller domain-containing protein [Nonomuraea phyllanthi]|uniref:beta-propeller domain-containing protein n=1 Tax=Nonomuraea phyllanthi TaxID=2219224 RepID=UPI00186AF3E7|nr:beta-propeller domain-containing protein [Nonomuraea phyllanthi]
MKTLIRTAAAAAALATVTTACTAGTPSPEPRPTRLGAVRLVAYTSCDDLLSGLREHAARSVTPYGLQNGMPVAALAKEARTTAKADTSEHSTTNVHEAGVDEPDVVKTDGDRVITVKDGVLRVIDTATQKVTGSLRLTNGDGVRGVPADLLLSGDRALVLMRGGDIMYKAVDFVRPGETKYVLVDLSGAPKVLSTIKPQGSYVDARMVGSTVKLVTRSQPDIAFPEYEQDVSESERLKANQETVRRAPAEAWLPKIEITDAAGTIRRESVTCERVSHPADYSGTSLLTVHTIDLARGVTASGTDPITLAADGDTVYGTGTSLYVAGTPHRWMPLPPPPRPLDDTPATRPRPLPSQGVAPAEEPTPTQPQPTPIEPTSAQSTSTEPPPTEPTPTEPSPSPTVPPEETEIHRFDLSSPGAPSYVASTKVPGRLLNQYSLSEYDGHLRIATTLNSPDGRTSSSTVYVLDATTMARTGEVGGLGKGERIYSVRFIGPVGYCVTFKQVDPLYTLDLRDPAAPKVTGELKITGYSAYLHPAGEGRLIGIGQEASEKGRTLGTQVSLFDVGDPAAPRRLSQLFQKDSGSAAEWDPHAFLYWPKTGLAVVPLTAQNESGALVLKIDDSGITRRGLIQHSGDPSGIQRAMVIGDALWTLSYEGIQVNDAATLAERSWIPLR